MKKLFAALDHWASKHHPKWIDAIRIALGIIIHLKALLFIDATAEIIRTLEIYHLGINAKILVYSISVLNLLCGTLLMLGLQTRIVAVIQIPIVIVSSVYALLHVKGHFLTSELLLSFIVLILLLFFVAEGSGKFSVDEYFRNSYKTYMPEGKGEA